jgi:hypothetical protein
MDAKHFDQLVKSLFTTGTRRGVLRLLSSLPLVGGVAGFLREDEADAKGHRHRRRVKRHKHGKGRHKRKKNNTCKPKSTAQTCAGKCGPVKNTCNKTVNCGPCDCDPPCGICATCSDALVCKPCDPCCDDVCCQQANAVCHATSGACCVPDSTAQTCHNQCGDVVNNCGVSVDCGPCTCDGGCPACQICDDDSGECIPDPSQQGDACGEEGQVCQSDGMCSCDANSCPSCTTCENDGFCAACADCCDDRGVCQDGDTKTACGSSGTCDGCTGQEECQNQTCVCVPDCTGKVCGSDGCTGTCAPGCGPNSTCTDGGTLCECDFVSCDDACCADGESCCGSDCTDTNTDPEHCGACNTTCPEGQVCQGGVCGLACGSDFCPAATEICDGGTCQSCDVCPTCAYTTVQAAVADGSGPNTIRICPGTYGKITVTRSLTLIGAGEGASAGNNTILDAQQTGGTVVVSNAGAVTLRRLRITGGSTILGSGVSNSGSTLTLTNCTVTGNSRTNGEGGGVLNAFGASLTMTDCTISDNHVPGGQPRAGGIGGGLGNVGQATLTNCTISGNSAGINGGGIGNAGPLTLDGGEVSGNTAGSSGGGIRNNGGTVTLLNDASVTANFAPAGTPNNCAGTPVPGCTG